MTGPNMLLDPARLGSEAENLEKDLRRRVVGQEDAVRQIVDMYQTFLAGMATPGRPVGTLLFLGPTGAGKTHTVEALAESLAGDRLAVLKIDCGEFQHSHEIAKLIGSPPGYLGHRETHPLLSQEALDQFHTEKLKLSFVLFDEIEKASDALWNLLLGILDKATLTLGDNRRVDFSRAMIFLTSNLGAADMNAILHPKLGFTAGHAVPLDDATTGRLARSGLEAARRRFSPEFMNRIDRTVVFRPLGSAELCRVLDLELEAVQERLERSAEAPLVQFTVNDAAREFLLREGVDPRYGARHLKRAIERRLVHPLSSLIATGQIQAQDRLVVDFDPGQQRLLFFKEFREPVAAAATAA
ncbi:MAG TPA: AAA family ATPase [Bryobacteraceae bacterium]|nr:AAA family ATPase [Bryobacteraceae bacterium]